MIKFAASAKETQESPGAVFVRLFFYLFFGSPAVCCFLSTLKLNFCSQQLWQPLFPQICRVRSPCSALSYKDHLSAGQKVSKAQTTSHSSTMIGQDVLGEFLYSSNDTKVPQYHYFLKAVVIIDFCVIFFYKTGVSFDAGA